MAHRHPLISNYTWIVALFILFLVAAFYIHTTQSTFIIADEYLVYRFTRDDFGQTLAYLINRDVHPPLWFSFFWGWRRIVGESDFAGRVQAIYFSLITLAIMYQIGKRWFGHPRYGIAAMLTLSVSSLFFIYALQIRPYGLAMLLATLSMFAFQQWLTVKNRRSAVVYAASVALLLYVHYFLFLLVIFQGLFFLLFARSLPLFRQLPLVGTTAFLIFLPWLPSFLNQVQHIREVELASGNARGIAGSSVTTFITSGEEVLKLAHLASNGMIWLSLSVLAVGTFYWWRSSNYHLAFGWAFGLPLIAFTTNLFFAVYNPRYIVNFIIGLALAVAASIGRLPKKGKWLGLGIYVALNLWMLPSLLPRDIIPYRLLIGELVSAYQPGDAIFINPPTNRGVEFNWQYSHQFSTEMKEAIVTSLEDALTARRIWYLTGDWFNTEIRTTYVQIEQTHPRQSGFGKCDRDWCYLIQLMEAPPWTTPQIFGRDIAFWGADIDQVTSDLIRTRLWWTVEETPSQDYSIGLHLLDEYGSLVAQSDGPIRHYAVETYQTTQLHPSRIYIDFRDLHFSPPLAPGDYTLTVMVYNWQTLQSLPVANDKSYLELSQIHINEDR